MNGIHDEKPVGLLLVGDRPENLGVLEVALRDLGEPLVLSDPGRGTLEPLLDRDYAAVLLDVRDQRIDGRELASLIRAGGRTRTTPILFVTPEVGANRVAGSFRIEGVDCIPRPIDPDLLRAKISVLVDLSRKSRRVERQSLELKAAGEKLDLESRERRRIEEALQCAREEARGASRFKDEFLSIMSHELRTPLNAVLGFSELLTDETTGALTERQRRYVNHVLTGGRHLLALVNDILELSRIEAGRVDLRLEDVRIENVAADVVETLRPLADRKSQELLVKVEPGQSVRADVRRLKQILMHLVGNAVMYTQAGGRIELVARRAEGGVRLEVRDTGPGIPPEERNRIFDPFYRIRKPGGESTEGTGLGLTICTRLVGLHGARLHLESEPGKGSVFSFELEEAWAGIDGLAPGVPAAP
jgi:signal transduction histidine kinase